MTETELKLRHYENLLAIFGKNGSHPHRYPEEIVHLLHNYRGIFIDGDTDLPDSILRSAINELNFVPSIDLTGLTPS